MNKKVILKKIIAICLIAFIGITLFPVISFAKTPTIDTKASAMTIGKNQLKARNYNGRSDTLLGSFTAPETGKYTFYVTNNGSESLRCHVLDEDLAEISVGSWRDPTEYSSFTNWSLKKNEKIYFYVESLHYDTELLAAKVDIQQVSVAKASPKLNKSAVSLKVKHKTTLKLKNNKKPIIWVSSNKKIATVSSKGVVTAKKKGTAYIYAIANHKLYKCKVSVYK